MSSALTEAQRTEINSAVRDASRPDIVIRGVTIDERGEPQDVYILVEVKLAKPEHESWPSDAFYKFRRQIRNAVAQRLGPDVDLRLTYVPEDPDEEDGQALENGAGNDR